MEAGYISGPPAEIVCNRGDHATLSAEQLLEGLFGYDIALVETVRYMHLGVTIIPDLRWNKHVSNNYTKANKRLGFLKSNLILSFLQDVEY